MSEEGFKGTRIYEPATCETLYFSPSWHPYGVSIQSMAIGSVEQNILSIIANRSYEGGNHSFIHLTLTKEETDLLINALTEIKQRWEDNDLW